MRAALMRLSGIAACAAVLGGALVVLDAGSRAEAIPPFPIFDDTDGVPGEPNPAWASVITGTGATGNVYTTDQWLRLTNAGTFQGTNILNDIPFPSTTGFVVDFDYRQAGGTLHQGGGGPLRTGDGMSMYLVDGTAPVTAGGVGSGLAYAGNEAVCGVEAGYVGVGLDVYGNFAAPSANSGGGPGVSMSTIGVRGSGTPPCDDPATRYPWVDGVGIPDLWTGTPGDTSDPATEPNSLYRHVRVTVSPTPGSVQLTIEISDLVPKSQPYGELTEVLSVDVADVPGQTALPPTLKLGFGASTGLGTDYHDIRHVRVAAYTDAALTKTLSAATPSGPGLPAGQFLPGQPIAFTLTAVNDGPSAIGDAPDGTARVFDDLSSLPLTDVTWTCSGDAGGACITPSGTGPVVSADWTAPSGGGVTVEVTATVAATAPSGAQTNTAVIPTDFVGNTVGPDGSPVQRDDGALDTDTANNTASASFTVVRPAFSAVKSADATAYAVGQPVTYTLTVTNSGAPGTADIADTVPGAIEVGGATCAVTGSGDCTASFTGNDVQAEFVAQTGDVAVLTITGTAVAVGTAENTALVTPTDPYCATGCGGGPATTGPTAVVPTALSLVKSAVSGGSPVTELTVGMPIDYRYTVTNTGQYPLEAIAIEELAFTGSGTLSPAVCPQPTLQPAEAMTCTATYTVTQDDIDGGVIDNTALATGNAPGSPVVTESAEAALSLPIPASPALALTKSAEVSDTNGSGRIDAGDTVVWSFLASNTGDVTLRELTIDDAAAGVVRCETVTLAPAAVTTCRSLSYTITQGDAVRGEIVNRATATALDPRSTTITSAVATARIPVVLPAVPPVEEPGLAATGSDTAATTWGALALALLGAGTAIVLRRRAHRGGA